MISARQIKMARAMLDWSQEDLAQASRLSPNTIYNLEKGHISPRKLTVVRAALENKGVEFLGTNGVDRRAEEHKSYGGADSCDKFYGDLLSTVKERDCEITAIFETQEILAKALGATNRANLDRLERLSTFAKVRCLLSDAGNTSLFLPFFEFRAISKHPLAPISILMYGDKLALVVVDGIDFSFFVVSSMAIVQNGLKRFESNWDAALPLAM